MRILIVGAAGLIGRQLAAMLCHLPGITLRLADRVPISPPPGAVVPVECRTGDFCDEAFARDLLQDVDRIFHFAALLAVDSEADLHRGLAVNVSGLMQLLRLCEALPAPPRFIYPSSVAAFGGTLPDLVDDHVPRTPRTSYGTHKAIAELLIDDYSRRNLVDGRVLRLPIVLVRNGPPGTAVSDRVAALVREPLLGRDVTCGLHPDTPLPVTSASHAAAAFLRLSELDATAFPHGRAMNLPSLTVTPADLSAAVDRAPVRRKGRITWSPDPALQAVVDGWPRRFTSEHARSLGLASPETADSIVSAFVAENGLCRGTPRTPER